MTTQNSSNIQMEANPTKAISHNTIHGTWKIILPKQECDLEILMNILGHYKSARHTKKIFDKTPKLSQDIFTLLRPKTRWSYSIPAYLYISRFRFSYKIIRIKDKWIDFQKKMKNGVKGQISITDEQMPTVPSLDLDKKALLTSITFTSTK
jgi:hypothetical protein